MKADFKSFVNHLFRSELLKSASLLFTGTVVAQAIALLLQPFLRRYFSPEAFGAFSVYMSLVGIISVISCLKYDDAIMLPEKDSDSINIIGLALIFNFTVSLLILLVVIIFGRHIVAMLELPEDYGLSILYLVPAGSFLYNLYQALNNWLIRKKRFLDVSVNKIVRRGTEGAAQIIFALLKSFRGLVYGDIIGQIMNIISGIVLSVRQGFSLRPVTRSGMTHALREYSDFPKFFLLPSFMSTCSFLLPVIIINKIFSANYAGYFDMTKLILSIPVAFVASSFSGVILQKTSERYLKGESIIGELKPVLLIVLTICIFEFLIIIPFGVDIFKFVFGEKWEMSGIISRILVWSFAFNFLVATFSSLFISMRSIKVYSIWQLIYFIGIISLMLFRNLEFTSFLKVYVIIEVICYLIVTLLLVAIVLKYERSIRLS